ncbi:hypothetical protein AB4037_23340 [Labrys sp. KB_33_2]|uniref:hypothetical protein n=1 Tax=Labrys sp. KB_33_2 TaxID=3237479 RepID=UPI003F8E45B9
MTDFPPKKKHGGSRAGSGRPKGRLNTLTEAEKRKALARGLSPLEVMTDLMNHSYRRWKAESRKKTPDEDALMAKQKATLEAAEKLAPYLHPKLAAVQHTGKGGGPIQTVDLTKLSDAELAALEPVVAALAAAGAAAGADPEGEGS